MKKDGSHGILVPTQRQIEQAVDRLRAESGYADESALARFVIVSCFAAERADQ